MERFDSDLIRRLVSEGKSYNYISNILKEIAPDTRGLSERSIRRFYNINDIRYRSGQQELKEAVSEATMEVCIGYIKIIIAKLYGWPRGESAAVAFLHCGPALIPSSGHM